MFLRKLYINDEIYCDFHDGLNIIIAHNHTSIDKNTSLQTCDTNGVGKSLIVNLVKKILGGDVENIFDSSYFVKKRVFASLEVANEKNEYFVICYSFLEKLRDYRIVFKGNFQEYSSKILSKELSLIENPFDFQECFKTTPDIILKTKSEFNTFINQLENIDYSSASISFSSLLDFIIRDEKNGFSDIISRIRRSQKVQYRSILYLFGLPYDIENKINDLTQQISDNRILIESKQRNLANNGIKYYSDIEDLRSKLSKDLEKILSDKNKLRVTKSIESVRKEYRVVRNELIKINTQINEKETQIENFKENIKNIKEKKEQLPLIMDIEEFYNNLVGLFPDKIKKNFEEYKNFVNSISTDRQTYFEKAIFDTTQKKKELNNKKKIIKKNMDKLALQLSDSEIVDDISLISQQEQQINNELNQLDQFEIDLKHIESIAEKNDKLDEERNKILLDIKKKDPSLSIRREELTQKFAEIITYVYQKPDCNLTFEFNNNLNSTICGRTEINCSIPSDKSHGRTNAKICLFDFTWFFDESNIYKSGFLIHDGPYSKISEDVKLRMIEYIVAELKDKKNQYIITVNESELPNYMLYKDYFCKELNGESNFGKFMKEQFDA